jgi:hypothetical protein
VTRLTRLKLALALVGLTIFAAGVRYDERRLRVSGIGFVAVAWLLRFANPRRKQGSER